MSLLDLLKKPFSRKKTELIAACILPIKVLPGWIDDGDSDTAFDRYADDLEKAISDSYGHGFRVSKKVESIVEYAYSDGDTDINYTLSADLHDRTKKKHLYRGTLTIMQKQIDLERAGKLLNHLLPEWALSYDAKLESRFTISYSTKDGKQSEGLELLDKMGVRPINGAIYYIGEHSSGWAHIRSKQGLR